MEALDDIIALAALALVALGPGAGLLVATGIASRLPGVLVVPLALLASTVLAAPVAVAQMALHERGLTMLLGWLPLALVGALFALAPLVGTFRHRWARRRLATRVRRAALPIVAAVGLGMLGFVVGGLIDGDAMYHAMYAEKLAHLPNPDFARTQLFADGSPHAGYLAPGWHFLVAQAALASSTSVPEVMRVGAALVLPCAALAYFALGRAVFASARGGAFVVVGFLLVDVLRPASVPVWGSSVAMWPGSIALWVAVPALLAAWFTRPDARRHGMGGGRAAAIAIASVAIVVLHVTYLVWIAIVACAWLVVSVVRRDSWRHALAPPAVVALAGGLATAAYVLLSQRVLGDADSVLTGTGQDDRDFYAGLFAGDETIRLAPEVFFANGAVTLLAMLGAAAASLVIRRPGALTVAVTTGIVVAFSQVPPLMDALAATAGLSHTVRLAQVVPFEVGVGAVLLALAVALDRAWQGGVLLRGMAIVGLAAAVGAGYAASRAWPPLELRFADPEVPRSLAYAVVVVALVLSLAAIVAWRRDVAGFAAVQGDDDDEPVDRPRGGHHWRLHEPGTATGALVATVALVLAAFPMMASASRDVADRLPQLAESPLRRDAFALLPPTLAEWLDDRPVGSIVLAPASIGKVAPVAATVYVAAYPAIHTANTERNRRDERIRDARQFVFGPRSNDRFRLAVLHESGTDYVVAPRREPGGGFILDHRRGLFVQVQVHGGWIVGRVDHDALERMRPQQTVAQLLEVAERNAVIAARRHGLRAADEIRPDEGDADADADATDARAGAGGQP